jgi:hypothetical protein
MTDHNTNKPYVTKRHDARLLYVAGIILFIAFCDALNAALSGL